MAKKDRRAEFELKSPVFQQKNGVGEGTRTLDLLGHNQAL